MGNIRVLVPVGEVRIEEMKMAERPSDLRGKTLGLLWNNKTNGDLLLRDVGEGLQQEIGFSETMMRKKGRGSSGAPAELLEEMSGKSRLVILAIGD